jgi:hypothetical protein
MNVGNTSDNGERQDERRGEVVASRKKKAPFQHHR